MNSNDKQRVIAVIRNALLSNDVDPHGWNGEGLVVTPTTVTEINPTPLADLILNTAFPPAPSEAEYWHYTSFTAARHILKERTFRLYSVMKRIDEGEFRPFCEDHHCSGYIEIDPATGQSLFRGLCRDLFYGSFVRVGEGDQEYMWRVFASQHCGVRFRLRITPTLQRAEIRPVVYANEYSQTLVAAVMDAVSSLGGPQFILRGISRIAAFYLRFDNSECETRLLIKRYSGGVDLATGFDGNQEYFPLKVQADHDWCRIDILGLECGSMMGDIQHSQIDSEWTAFTSA